MAARPPPPTPPWHFAVAAGAMLLLHVVPLDMMTTPLWLVLFVFWIGALRALARELFSQRRAAVLVACALSAALWPGSCVNQFYAWGETAKRVNALADQAQRGCVARGRCPTVQELCGAEDCGTGGTTVRHDIHYRVTEDAQEFVVSARLSIDDAVSARGGVKRPLVQRARHDEATSERVVIEPADAGAR